MKPYVLLNLGSFSRHSAYLCIKLFTQHNISERFNVIVLGSFLVLSNEASILNLKININELYSFSDSKLDDLKFDNQTINIIDISKLKYIKDNVNTDNISNFMKSYFIYQHCCLIMKKSLYVKMVINFPMDFSKSMPDNFPYKNEIDLMSFFFSIPYFEIDIINEYKKCKEIQLKLEKNANIDAENLYEFFKKVIIYKSMLNIKYPTYIENNGIIDLETISYCIKKINKSGYGTKIYAIKKMENYLDKKIFLIKPVYNDDIKYSPKSKILTVCSFPFLNIMFNPTDKGDFDDEIKFLINLLSYYKTNHIDYFIKSYY